MIDDMFGVLVIVIVVGLALLTQDGFNENSLKRVMVWAPIPTLWIVLWVLTRNYTEFWQSDRAALPAVLIILMSIGYGAAAISLGRRYK